ncbi:MAG: FumA C-terminus/TtdB family hydratase beta subunit [Kiritimatiellae bacterium]|nr:FumA C-terminus/TtdB family hydratase beta subunit [Kiritimatiellia bacterium]
MCERSAAAAGAPSPPAWRDVRLPPDDRVWRTLRAGEWVRLYGEVVAARDAAHRRMWEALNRGEPLPFDLRGATIYYVGPTPGGPDRPVGSAGPTTSSRMDVYTPRLIQLGLRGMIGKGQRSAAVIEAIRQHGAVYFLAVGGAGALLGRCVQRAETIAYEDLGPEAVRRLTLVGFPAVVAIDAQGHTVWDRRAEGAR